VAEKQYSIAKWAIGTVAILIVLIYAAMLLAPLFLEPKA
jgi:hypothetical protein